MVRDIHDYDSLKKAYDVLLMFERFPGSVRSERVEEFVTQLKRDIREYVNRVSDCRIVRDDRYDGMGCSGQFFTTRVRLFRRRGCWYAYHFVSVDM